MHTLRAARIAGESFWYSLEPETRQIFRMLALRGPWLAVATAFASLPLRDALLAAGLAVYFWPSIVAHDREHPDADAVTALNLLLGWTMIGWLAALIWARSRPRPALPE